MPVPCVSLPALVAQPPASPQHASGINLLNCPYLLVFVLLSCSGEVLAFKAVVAGDTTAASKSTDAKALASGSYTFWKDATANVGTATTNSATTVADCLSACDKDAACAAVAMEGAVSLTAQITCKLIKGDSSVAQFKRSVTKVNVNQLTLALAA